MSASVDGPVSPPPRKARTSRTSNSHVRRPILSTPTLPSPPVTMQVNSGNASSHLSRTARVDPLKDKRGELPPISAFTFDGLLDAIHDDIEPTMNAIAEIMGRSRLSLANEYGSHMPPQGEIARHLLHPVEEASANNEAFPQYDNVIIVPEDASLVDGSLAGSAAYGLLERLRVAPQRPRGFNPAALPPGLEDFEERHPPTTPHTLLNNGARATLPTISSTRVTVGADERPVSSPVADGEDAALYFDPRERDPGEAEEVTRMQNLAMVSDLRGLAVWLGRERREREAGGERVESRLRAILERNRVNHVEEIEAGVTGTENERV